MTPRWPLAVTAGLVFLAAACSSSTSSAGKARRRESAVSDASSNGRATIAYAAHGGFPRTEATLHVDGSGQARMFLGSTMSLPPAGELDRVGSFDGTIDPATYERVIDIVAALPDELPAGAPPVPGSVIRTLVVTISGRPREVTIPGYAPAPLDEVERLLQETMVQLVADPSETVSASLEVGGQGVPAIVVSSVGSRPVTLRFVGDDGHVTAGGTVVVLGSSGEMYDTLSLDAATVSNVVGQGPTTLAPQAALRFPFAAPDEVPKGRAMLSGGLEFDLQSGGQFHRVSVQAAQVPYPR